MKLTDQLTRQWSTLAFERRLNARQPPPLVYFQAACSTIVTERRRFPMLGNGRGQRRVLYTGINRERRVERLRMMARSLAVLGGSADLLTLSDGRRTRDGICHPLTEKQIGESLELDAEHVAHDSRGMRAMRSALRDLDDGGFITRAQPKVQYCGASNGGCGRRVPRGGTCECGRRSSWRWRSLTTIITITKRCFASFGLLPMLEEWQKRRADEMRAGGVTPIRSIVAERNDRRIVKAQLRAAKLAQLTPEPDARRAADEERRLRKLFGDKPRE